MNSIPTHGSYNGDDGVMCMSAILDVGISAAGGHCNPGCITRPDAILSKDVGAGTGLSSSPVVLVPDEELIAVLLCSKLILRSFPSRCSGLKIT